ncbi:MAG: hypothetical protein GY745_13870 [Actinomycetia bacterium]|nr:hypothetical protein [Actinomycetes bacterium]
MIKSLATTPAYAACGSLGTILLDNFSQNQTEATTVPSNGSFVFDTRLIPLGYTFLDGTLTTIAANVPGRPLALIEYVSTAGVILPGVGDCTELVMDNVISWSGLDSSVNAQVRHDNGTSSTWLGDYSTSPSGRLILTQHDGPALSSSPITKIGFAPAGRILGFIDVVCAGPLYLR